jgi:hypothetical protein
MRAWKGEKRATSITAFVLQNMEQQHDCLLKSVSSFWFVMAVTDEPLELGLGIRNLV